MGCLFLAVALPQVEPENGLALILACICWAPGASKVLDKHPEQGAACSLLPAPLRAYHRAAEQSRGSKQRQRNRLFFVSEKFVGEMFKRPECLAFVPLRGGPFPVEAALQGLDIQQCSVVSCMITHPVGGGDWETIFGRKFWPPSQRVIPAVEVITLRWWKKKINVKLLLRFLKVWL